MSAGGATGTEMEDRQVIMPSSLSLEWTRGRDLVEKLDERIHDTRKLVFALFTTGLFSGAFLSGQIPLLVGPPPPTGPSRPVLWFACLALLLLLAVGRFIE